MNINILKSICVCFLVMCVGCKKENESKVDSSFVQFMAMNIFQTEEFSLPSYYPLKDMAGHTYRLDSVLKCPKLIFRFSEHNCETCIESEIKLINHLNMSNHILGFASYSNIRMLKLAQKKYNIKFPLYFLPFGQNCILPEDKEELGKPYLFVMRQDFCAKYIMFPSLQYPEMSEKYYQEVSFLLEDSTTVKKDIFTNKIIDLGTIVKGKTYKVKFEYTNNTSDPLIIESVNSSCGCTVPQWDRQPLMQGKSSELIVSFTPEVPGYNSKIVMVSHNKTTYPLKLVIKANVE